MAVLTAVLMRTSSRQLLVLSTTSRGTLGSTEHSRGFSAQNSTQPIGGRAVAPVETNSARSLPACAVFPAPAITKQQATSILLASTVIVSPRPVPEDHVSHKHFEFDLSFAR